MAVAPAPRTADDAQWLGRQGGDQVGVASCVRSIMAATAVRSTSVGACTSRLVWVQEVSRASMSRRWPRALVSGATGLVPHASVRAKVLEHRPLDVGDALPPVLVDEQEVTVAGVGHAGARDRGSWWTNRQDMSAAQSASAKRPAASAARTRRENVR